MKDPRDSVDRLSPWWPSSPQGKFAYKLIFSLAFIASAVVGAGGAQRLWEGIIKDAPIDEVLGPALISGVSSLIGWYIVLTIVRAIYLAITQQ